MDGRIPEVRSWDQRVNPVLPLPGGYTGYLESFRKIYERLQQGSVSFEELVAWAKCEFEISETSSRYRLNFLRNAGLIESNAGIVSVTEPVHTSLQRGDDHILIGVMHSRVRFIGEMLRETQEPRSAEELRKRARAYGLEWETLAQIDNRRGWLMSAKLLEGTNQRLVLTNRGEALLRQLDVVEPNENKTKARMFTAEVDSSMSASEAQGTGTSAEELAKKVVEASTDSSDPVRFELLVRDAFRSMGFVAEHLGGSGRTDVLLTAPLGKDDAYRVAVDAKTTGTGSLREDQVNWPTLEEHRQAHGAEYSLLVAPDPTREKLRTRALAYSVTLLSAEQVADLCRRHARAPLSLVHYERLFSSAGEADLGVLEEATEQVASLRRLASVICDDLPEKTDRFGRMSARDVRLALDEEFDAISDDEIERLLDVLSHPLIGAVHRFDTDEPSINKASYVPATSLDACRYNIRLLSDEVAKNE